MPPGRRSQEPKLDLARIEISQAAEEPIVSFPSSFGLRSRAVSTAAAGPRPHERRIRITCSSHSREPARYLGVGVLQAPAAGRGWDQLIVEASLPPILARLARSAIARGRERAGVHLQADEAAGGAPSG